MGSAERIVSAMQELQSSARAIRQGCTDRLRVISVPPFLQQIIPAAVARRIRSNPQLSIRLDVARRVDLPDWINRRDFDLAIVGLPVDRPEVNIHPLPTVEAVAVLPRGHALAKQQRVSLRQVVDGPLVAHSSGPLMRFELDRALATHGLQSAPAVEAPTAWLCLCRSECWNRVGCRRSVNRRRPGRVGCRRPTPEGEDLFEVRDNDTPRTTARLARPPWHRQSRKRWRWT